MPEHYKFSIFKATIFMAALGSVCGLHAAPPSSIEVPTLDSGPKAAAHVPGQDVHGSVAPLSPDVASAPAAAGSVAPVASAPVLVKQPIDIKAVARKFSAGKFRTRMMMTGPTGHPGMETDVMCMSTDTAEVVVAGVTDGLDGCDVQSSRSGKSSIAVTANCPALGQLGPNFYTGLLHWSRDGKQIAMETKRVALDPQGLPTNKVLQAISYKLSYLSPGCQ